MRGVLRERSRLSVYRSPLLHQVGGVPVGRLLCSQRYHGLKITRFQSDRLRRAAEAPIPISPKDSVDLRPYFANTSAGVRDFAFTEVFQPNFNPDPGAQKGPFLVYTASHISECANQSITCGGNTVF